MPDETPVPMEIGIDPKLISGAFADRMMVWHNEHGFTLDFATQSQPGVNQGGALPVQVVARVRVPPTVIFQIARAIAENVDRFEKTYGPISRGGPGRAQADEPPRG